VPAALFDVVCVKCGASYRVRSVGRLTEELAGAGSYDLCEGCACRAALEVLPRGEAQPAPPVVSSRKWFRDLQKLAAKPGV
jgi:hypothetical protein